VATLDTTRTATRIVDSADELLAEVDDDLVRASTNGTTATEWREIEVELGSGDEPLLSAIGERLVDAGAVPARRSSKLGYVLGEPDAAPKAPGRIRTLADLVALYLQAQYSAIIDGDLWLRSGQDAVHATRVATRRYRSVLRVFGGLLDPERAAALDTELAWYASLLGAVRDRDVLRAHLDRLVASLPRQVVLGPVTAGIDEKLLSERLTAERKLLRQMRGKRYFALLAELKAWHQPAFVETTANPAASVDTYVRKAIKALSKRLKQAARADDADELLHRARKAAKRARYTAELAEPALDKPARRLVKRAKRLQDVLGEHQDSIVASEFLLRLGATAGTRPGENGFTYGVLYAYEQQRAESPRLAAASSGRSINRRPPAFRLRGQRRRTYGRDRLTAAMFRPGRPVPGDPLDQVAGDLYNGALFVAL
jgi:CHAD domain-containing protein